MKKIHIILIIVIVVAIGVIISLISDSSTYADFEEAAKHPNKEFHVIGVLNMEKEISFDTSNVNQFSFFMTDSKGVEKLVIHKGPKPQDFEKSSQVVSVGKIDGDHFLSSSLLLKCPSKYNEEKKPETFGTENLESETTPQ